MLVILARLAQRALDGNLELVSPTQCAILTQLVQALFTTVVVVWWGVCS
jgi:hypothetical protein